MEKILVTLYSAIDTDFLDFDDLNQWIIQIISRVKTPKYWLIELALYSDLRTMKEKVSNLIHDNFYSVDGYLELDVGFYYLQYKQSIISIIELERKLIDISDPLTVMNLDIYSMDAIFRKLPSSEMDREDYLDNIFGFYANESKKRLDYLLSLECLEKNLEFFSEN